MVTLSFPNKDAFPAAPDPTRVYIAADTTKLYFVNSGAYVEMDIGPATPQLDPAIIGADRTMQKATVPIGNN